MSIAAAIYGMLLDALCPHRLSYGDRFD